MLKYFVGSFALVYLSLFASLTANSWEKQNFPEININCQYNQFIGTNNGFYKFTSEGAVLENFGMNTEEILSIHVQGDLLYAGTDKGIFRSGIIGISWVNISGIIGKDKSITAITNDDNGNLIVATRASGIYLSSNGGADWQKMNHPWGQTWVQDIAIDNLNHIYAGTGDGVYKSMDGGNNWTLMNNGLNYSVRKIKIVINEAAMSPNEKEVLLAGTTAHGVYYSTDGAATWNKSKGELSVSTVTDLIQTNCGIYCSTNDNDNDKPKAYLTQDWGNTWVNADTTLGYQSKGPDARIVNSIYYDCGKGLYAGTDMGMYLLKESTVGLQDIDKLSFSIFPNPASDVLIVELPKLIANEALEVFNMLGGIETEIDIELINDRTAYLVDLQCLTEGIYIIKIGKNSQMFVKKK